jgi:hypothetical protein
MNQDLQYLKLLSIFYYVVGGFLAFFSCFALIYLFMGVVFITAPPPSGGGAPPPPALGWIFVILSGAALLLGWTWAACLMIAGWFLGRRQHYMYCIILGCSALLFQPLGTILGVFTIIVLIRPSVKRLFETGGLPDDEEEMRFSDDPINRGSYNIRGER